MLPDFKPDYPWAKVFPAHESNVLFPEGHGGVPNKPGGFFIHTPEEPVDNYPGTPHWFQTPNIYASTQYFVSAQPDPDRPGFTQVYQMVPEAYYCYANGLTSGRTLPSWAKPGTSLNWQSNHVEVEGKADSIATTLVIGGPQWKSLIHLVQHRAAYWGYPTDREHILGHYQVSNSHYDPGPNFPWDALIRDLNSGQQGDDMFTRLPQNSANPAYWHGRSLAQGAEQGMNLRGDFALPSSVKEIELEVFLMSGAVDLMDGGTADGLAGFVRGQGHYRIKLDATGMAWFRVVEACQIDMIRCLGYYS